MKWKNLPTNLCAEITGVPPDTKNFLDRGDKILSQIAEVDPSIIDEEDRLTFVEVVAATEAILMVTLKSVTNVRARKVKEIVERATYDLARHRMYAAANALTRRITPLADGASPFADAEPSSSDLIPIYPGRRRWALGVQAVDHLATRATTHPHEGSMIIEHIYIPMEDERPGIFEMTNVRVGEKGDSMRVMGASGGTHPLAGRDASELAKEDEPLAIFGASHPVDAETPLIFEWKLGPRQTSERFHPTVWGTVYPTRQEAVDEMKRRAAHAFVPTFMRVDDY